MRLIGVKLPEYGHYWEGNPAAFLSINLVETEQFEEVYGSIGHGGVEYFRMEDKSNIISCTMLHYMFLEIFHEVSNC